jgi:N-acetylmuramoyl-L-alanine amidase
MRFHARLGLVLALGLPATGLAATAPVVWVQAGHEGPREPGYRDQTGATGGPFGSEVNFTTRASARLISRLRAAGIDARRTAGLVEPLGADGATFISIHFDQRGGAATVGYAVATGGGENFYHGEGVGTASRAPYADSARHRSPTRVTSLVQDISRGLATRISANLGRARTTANGANGRFTGLTSPSGNRRVMHYYGYYRTNAAARILVECGSAGADDVFLGKTDLVSETLANGVIADLRARKLLPGG